MKHVFQLTGLSFLSIRHYHTTFHDARTHFHLPEIYMASLLVGTTVDMLALCAYVGKGWDLESGYVALDIHIGRN